MARGSEFAVSLPRIIIPLPAGRSSPAGERRIYLRLSVLCSNAFTLIIPLPAGRSLGEGG
ncbi:MAG: hypothetical protein AAB489_05365 [Patescibacteria group bacterium]